MKVLVRGPALTRTGYGEHCRFVLRALRQVEDAARRAAVRDAARRVRRGHARGQQAETGQGGQVGGAERREGLAHVLRPPGGGGASHWIPR